MKLHEEFKEYESLWEDTNNYHSSKQLLRPSDKYKSLLAQIDSDGNAKYAVKELSDRVLTMHIETMWGNSFTRIIFNTKRNNFTLQLLGDTANSGTIRDLSWPEVLDYLIGEGIIDDTNLCG